MDRFANEWVIGFAIFTVLMLIDMIAAFFFYGLKTLILARREFLWEALVQLGSFTTLIFYAAVEKNAVKE